MKSILLLIWHLAVIAAQPIAWWKIGSIVWRNTLGFEHWMFTAIISTVFLAAFLSSIEKLGKWFAGERVWL